MDVSPRFRELAEEKLARAERFGLDIARIDVEVSMEKNPRLSDRAIEVELTCIGRGNPLRAEAHAPDKFTALDLATDTLTERLRRQADKRNSKRRRHTRIVDANSHTELVADGLAPTDSEDVEEKYDPALPADVVFAEGPIMVREKTHDTAPMTLLEAIDQLELTNHDFFFYHDSEASRPSVVYRRRGYDYGLIRLDVS